MDSYGIVTQKKLNTTHEAHCEEISNIGFTIIENLLSENELAFIKDKLASIYEVQLNEVGKNIMEDTAETNVARCPLAYDKFFLQLAAHEKVLQIVKLILGDFITLHLQNGIIVKSDSKHHQTAWHRDLPYQEFTSSKPLALSALFCIDTFEPENGGTCVLPFSHKITSMPSQQYTEKWKLNIKASAGSVLLFDSMLYHKAGVNRSTKERVGINHVYTIPLIKQQIDLTATLAGKYKDDTQYNQLLGYTSIVPNSVSDFRMRRYKKLKDS